MFSDKVKKEYNQRTGEEYIAWCRRILSGIAAGEIKMDWLDACILLGMKWDVNAARKKGEAYHKKDIENEKYLNERMKKLEETEDFTAADKKMQLLERSKIKMRDQKRMVNSELRKYARTEHILDVIDQAIRDTAGTISFDDYDADIVTIEKSTYKNEGVLLLSDWHRGQCSKNHWNTFNDAVFHERIQTLVNQTIDNGIKNNIRKLHVFALGDMINGLIHVTTRINNDENVVMQTVKAAETLVKMLEAFSRHFDVYTYFSRGNHDRISANKKEEISDESFFDFMQYYVEMRLGGEDHPTIHPVRNSVDPEIIRAEVAGHVCFGVHGHKDKTETAAKNLSTFMREIPDYIFMGHYHSAAETEVNGTEVIVNSSLCGTDDFAVSLRRYSKPSQKFMVFNRTGRICTYNILLSEKETLSEGTCHKSQKGS